MDITDELLQRIIDWKIPEDVRGLLDYVEDLWNDEYGDMECELSPDRKHIDMVLITGGWSDNESIVWALHSNKMFYELYWQASYRGGKHEYRIER